MSETQTQDQQRETVENFHKAAAQNGHVTLAMMAGLGAGPYFVAHSASHMIALSLAEIAKTDKDAAGALADELSAGFVSLLDRLGLMRDGGEDAQKA